MVMEHKLKTRALVSVEAARPCTELGRLVDLNSNFPPNPYLRGGGAIYTKEQVIFENTMMSIVSCVSSLIHTICIWPFA